METFEVPDGYDRSRKATVTVRKMTRDEIVALPAGASVEFIGRDGTLRRIKINGKVRTWKRDANRIEVPLKYGMSEYGLFGLDEALDRLVVRVEA